MKETRRLQLGMEKTLPPQVLRNRGRGLQKAGSTGPGCGGEGPPINEKAREMVSDVNTTTGGEN
jgi:hypothetical protein